MTIEVRNPRTGEHDYRVKPLNPDQVAEAAQGLRARQRGWAETDPEVRSEILRRWADAIERHMEPIAHALTLDTGRRGISRIEVLGIPRLIRRWADAAPAIIRAQQEDERQSSIPAVTTRTRLVAYPLVGVISPWNFPLTLSLIDGIPALAAGCAVLIKPSEVTPRFIRPLLSATREVPEIAAVMHIIEGDGPTGAAMIEHVDFICFTGSVATGRKVAEAAARAFIPASLELGGKDPMIVLASADPAKAAGIALRASVLNSGQACQSIERIYVAREIAQPFLEALVEAAQAVRLNYPKLEEGELGPFIFERQAEIVARQIEDARKRGARVLAGGEIERLGGGLYLRPTIVTDVKSDMAIMNEETFGPVIPVSTYETIEQAIDQANDSVFGLSAAVIGTAEEAESVAQRLHAGAVSINDAALTSSVWEAEKSSFKQSGLGPSRMGESGLLRFFRKQALIRQSGEAARLTAFSEEALSQ